MSPNSWRASLVRYLLYELNRIIDKQHPGLTPLPLFTLLIATWSSLILTLCPMYSLLISLLSHQLIPVPFTICSSLVQFAWSDAFYQCMKQAQISLTKSKVCPVIILIIPFASLFPCPLLIPNGSSPSRSSIFLFIPPKYPCNCLCCMCDEADYVVVATFCSSWLL